MNSSGPHVLSSTLAILLVFTTLAIGSAAIGVWMSSVPDVSRRIIPFSGIILILISLFGVLPELAGTFGWPAGLALMSIGFTTIFTIDRFVYPVCPACAPTHDHHGCATRLHGFATPLLAAVMIHSIFDGWALAAGNGHGALGALSLGVMLHKLPEGLAFGVILRAAMKSQTRAFAWAAAAQLLMLSGGLLQMASASYLGSYWITGLLALGGGMFLYLGLHAVHGEWKRRMATSQ